MKKFFQRLTFRAQLFLASTILMGIPLLILGTITANRSAQQVNQEYLELTYAITEQINLNLDTVLSDAEKIGSLHILNDDINRTLRTDYTIDMLKYAQDYQMMITQISQANRLNPNVINSIFINKYNFIFDFNFLINRELQSTLELINTWSKEAKKSNRNTYYAPVQYNENPNYLKRQILPIIKILKSTEDFSDVGILYIGINFNAITKILESSKISASGILFFDSNNELVFSNEEIIDDNMIVKLQEISNEINKENSNYSHEVNLGDANYTVNGAYNKTTGWKIIHIIDNSIITDAYKSNLRSYIFLFLIVILFGFLLAFLLSKSLTKSITQLSRQIDKSKGTTSLVLQGSQSNRELHMLVNSYNNMQSRLVESIKKNYVISLHEKQLKLQMFKLQINPHFLYNTLNLISSIANIHNVPKIKQITESISDLLRYNLDSDTLIEFKYEIKQIKRYITIQQIRFPNKFSFECNVPEELYDIEIPTFILQPIVENAINHGFVQTIANGQIVISTYTEEDKLHILITDNGCGIIPDKLDELNDTLKSSDITLYNDEFNTSIGLLNVHQRIRIYYGNEYGLTIESKYLEGTIVDIVLPIS